MIFYFFINHIVINIYCFSLEIYKNDKFDLTQPKSRVDFSPNLKNGDFVTVSWGGISNATIKDEIRIYCPTNLDDNIVLRKYTNEKYKEIGKPSGSIKIRVFYPRANCEFRYFSNNHDQLILLLKSNPVKFGMMVDEPTQIHLAFTDKQSEMRVSWVSGSIDEPCVFYGKDENRLNLKKCGHTNIYRADQMCEPPATTFGFIDPGYLHSVILDGLDDDQPYYYKVGNDNKQSNIYKFKSALSTYQKSYRKVGIGFFGDVDVTEFPGAYGTMKSVKKQIDEGNLDFVELVGDVSYAMGYGYTWEEFGYMIEPVASSVPFMVVIGNHEQNHIENHERVIYADGENFRPFPQYYNNDSGGECGVPTLNRYKMPGNGNLLYWYSYNYGPIHMVAISSEHDFRKGSVQYQWLENDLAKVDRKITPWLIVNIHRSIYISAKGQTCDPSSDLIKKELQDLLYQNRVNFVISGHYHFYERTCPVYKDKCVEGKLNDKNWGVVYMTVGTGGREIAFEEGLEIERNRSEGIISNKWSMQLYYRYGFGKMEILNNKEAFWSFIENESEKVTDTYEYFFDLDK